MFSVDENKNEHLERYMSATSMDPVLIQAPLSLGGVFSCTRSDQFARRKCFLSQRRVTLTL